MDAPGQTAHERPTLTFCVEGLPSRGELLFKAIVRLLDHLTQHQWRYHPPSACIRVDLLVVVEGTLPTLSESPDQPMQPMLQLGASGATRQGVLSWPVKPCELQTELNRMGVLIVAQRHTQAYGVLIGAIKAPAPIKPAATAPTVAVDLTTALLRLQQWPQPKLLTRPGCMRLATLLTGRTMGLSELARRAALPLDQCEEFLHDLHHAGLLMVSSNDGAPVQRQTALAAKPVQLGLLDRIRMRLGIQKSGSH